MEEKLIDLLKYVLDVKKGWIPLVVVLILFYFYVKHTDNVHKIFAQCLKIFRKIFRKADMAYIKYDMQGRMNIFISNMSNKIHSFSPVKISVNFYDDNSLDDPINYLNKGKYFVRVKKSANPNNNFVNLAMTFIADNLLQDAKKQISKKQKEAINLFVAKKLFEEENKEIMHSFVSGFLQPLAADDKVRNLYSKFIETDKVGLFFPVLLEELNFLGLRVFARPKDGRIKEEVIKLIEFLYEHANRKLGVKMKNDRFIGRFSKFGFMIVGKNCNVKTGRLQLYKKHLKTLMSSGIENIYLIGHERIQNFINQVTPDHFLQENNYYLYKKETYPSILKTEDGNDYKAKTYLLLIRKNNIDPFIQN